jgi:amidohydrolase family protein
VKPIISLAGILLAACASPSSIPVASAIPPITPRALPTTVTDMSQSLSNPTTQPSSAREFYAGQLDDAHIHYSLDSWEDHPISEITGILDRAGIKRALVSSTPNEGTLKLYAADPTRVVPEFRPYHTDADIGRWFANPETITFIEQGLSRIEWRGIGEFHLYGDQAKTPVVKRVVEIASEHNLVLHAHSDDTAIENLFAINPRAQILWAHTGMTTPVATVELMLERHPTLWAELSYRYDVSESGRLAPAWRALFLKYPDRFMYGTDTWVPSRWEDLPSLVSTARGWLAELPSDVADRIAYKNFETLFK